MSLRVRSYSASLAAFLCLLLFDSLALRVSVWVKREFPWVDLLFRATSVAKMAIIASRVAVRPKASVKISLVSSTCFVRKDGLAFKAIIKTYPCCSRCLFLKRLWCAE
jgi:hypothetical protein